MPNEFDGNFLACLVCGSTENEGRNLCSGCRAMGATFQALAQPGGGILNLIRQTKPASGKAVGTFFYLRQSQIQMLEQIVGACEQAGLTTDKSKVLRCALHLGLIEIQAMSFDALIEAVAILEAK